MIAIASNGHLEEHKSKLYHPHDLEVEREGGYERETHFFTQIPQPIHKNSEMKAILSDDLTSIHSLPRHLN